MDWRICTGALLLLAATAQAAAWTGAVNAAGTAARNHKSTEVSPYIDLVFCTLRDQPWTCARQQSARILNIWDDQLYVQWQKLKVDADQQLNAVLEKRGYSATDMHIKEKPSSMLKKIEIATNYMRTYLAETMDGFLGRELSYQSQSPAASNDVGEDDDAERADYTDRDESDLDDAEDDAAEDAEVDGSNNQHRLHSLGETINQADQVEGNASSGDEFIEIAESVGTEIGNDNDSDDTGNDTDTDNDEDDGGEKGAGNKNKNKRKNKNKKGHGSSAPSTVVLLQQVEPSSGHGHSGHGHTEVAQHDTWDEEWNDHGPVKPMKTKKKLKKRKNKRKHQHGGGGHGGDDDSIVVLEKPSSSSVLFDLVEEFADDDLLSSGGHKKKHNYGRSNGVTRGKKKKKKKALAKLVLLGSFLKAKIELLLKILGAHLQIKFFAIALIGLLINIARFWIDVKRGGGPQKVVYVEHAHHQHHYEDHGEDWNEQGGSYWKRSLQTDPTIEDDDHTEDSYQLKSQQQQPQQGYHHQQSSFDPHYLAYQNQWNRK